MVDEPLRNHGEEFEDMLGQSEIGSQPLGGRGHTSATFQAEVDGVTYVVKTPRRRGLAGWLTCRFLRREHQIYRRLAGVASIPRCMGLTGGSQLVLEFIEGRPLQRTDAVLAPSFYDELWQIIEVVHRRGVAHGDLKSRDNILVKPNGSPALVDFGAAIARRSGFHPLNRFLFDLACQLDVNAYLKHKYDNHLENMSAQDRAIYQPSKIEHLSRFCREAAKWVTRGFKNF